MIPVTSSLIRELSESLASRATSISIPIENSIYGAVDAGILGAGGDDIHIEVQPGHTPIARVDLASASPELVRRTCFLVLDGLLSRLATL